MRQQPPSNFSEWTHVQSIPSTMIIKSRDDYEQYLFFESAGGHIEARCASVGNFFLSHMHAELPQEANCWIHERGETLGLYFNLEGTAAFGNNHQHRITSGQQNLFFSSDAEEVMRITPQNNQWSYLEVHVPLSYYAEMLGDCSDAQRKFLEQIRVNRSGIQHAGIMPMTMPMKWIVNTILGCTREGILKKLFYEARILELLILQAEQFSVIMNEPLKRSPQSCDRDALHEARRILDENLRHPPTIKNLSRMVGMNEFNLKKGFKTIFNTTIYQYVNELRMHQARALIRDDHKSVQEVAHISGYKNPQHFTAAFKRFFGQPPSTL